MSTINHSRVSRVSLLSESRSTVDAATYRFVSFFLSRHYCKNNFFFLPEVFTTVYFHRDILGYFHWKYEKLRTVPDILFRFNIFFFPIFFRNLRIPSKRTCYIAISFARILCNTRGGGVNNDLAGMNNIFFCFFYFFIFLLFIKFLPRKAKLSRITRNLILFLSFFPLLITSGEKDQFQGLINFLLSNESITRGAIL